MTKVIEQLASFTLPSYKEIPDVGLYLDQVSKYINSYLQDFKEMEVTPSMISNYAKQKMITRVNKKTYTRDQIATLILIVFAKTVLSMDHIKILLHMLNPDNTSIEKAYLFFQENLLSVLSSFQHSEVNEGKKTLTKQ